MAETNQQIIDRTLYTLREGKVKGKQLKDVDEVLHEGLRRCPPTKTNTLTRIRLILNTRHLMPSDVLKVS